MLFCVYVAALRRDDPPSKGSYWLCIGFMNWKKKTVKVQRAVQPYIERESGSNQIKEKGKATPVLN
jgi:hypothetical protein